MKIHRVLTLMPTYRQLGGISLTSAVLDDERALMNARLGFVDDNPKCCTEKRVGKYFTLYNTPTVEIGPLRQSQEFLLDE